MGKLNAPVIEDGRQAERIRPDPLPAAAPAQTSPSIEEIEDIEEEKPEPSGRSAPDFGVSEDDEPKADNLVIFPAPEKTSRRGRKPREVFGTNSIYADPVRSSKNKWTIRVRWVEPDGSRPILTTRKLWVTEFNRLKRSKRTYETFTEQLIAVCRQRALRTSDGAGGRSNSLL
jgi:hypothetical protein